MVSPQPVRQVVAAHPVLGLQMTDDRPHRGPSLHQSPDGLCHASFLAVNKDLELPRAGQLVAAIAGIGQHALHRRPYQPFDLR